MPWALGLRKPAARSAEPRSTRWRRCVCFKCSTKANRSVPVRTIISSKNRISISCSRCSIFESRSIVQEHEISEWRHVSLMPIKMVRALPLFVAAAAGVLLCTWNSTARQTSPPQPSPTPQSASAPSAPGAAQTPYVPMQRQMPVPAMDDNTGFVPIFDGTTLNGWDGNPKYWRVENGAIVGEVTPETLLKVNTFLVWRGGTMRDFELKADYRISAKGNSGINSRSVDEPEMQWVMRGYKADIDGESRNANGKRYTGQNYEE